MRTMDHAKMLQDRLRIMRRDVEDSKFLGALTAWIVYHEAIELAKEQANDRLRSMY
jgi:hypothetical protein